MFSHSFLDYKYPVTFNYETSYLKLTPQPYPSFGLSEPQDSSVSPQKLSPGLTFPLRFTVLRNILMLLYRV